MKYIDLYKKSNIFKILSKDITGNSVSHAYMLIISDQVLANEYAKLFVMQYYCESAGSPCGVCNNCSKIIHSNMADVHYFPKNEKLTVEESRQIVAESFVLPYENNKKLFIISNFDKSTPQSQNALLKVLEEPTESNLFLLIADNTTQVLNTILSRVKKVIEPGVDDNDLLEFLKANYDNSLDIATAVTLSQGNLTKSIKILTNKKYADAICILKEMVIKLKSSSDVLKYASKLNSFKDNFNEVLDILLQLYLNLKIELCNGNTTSDYSKSSITKISNLIVDCKNKLKFNCNIVGIIDYLLFGILEAKYLCK